MDSSLTNFELNESIGDSENGSDRSDPLVEMEYEGSSSNGDDFDNNLPSTVTLLTNEKNGAKVYLVGTAHFSRESQEDVRKVIQHVRPNIVVLELCSARTNILSQDEETLFEEAKNLDTQKILGILRQSGVYSGCLYLLLLNTSVALTKQLGMAPGGEFRTAFQEAKKLPSCGVYLGDRPIHITLSRAFARLSWYQTIKLAWNMLTSDYSISPEEIEKFKTRDLLEQVLEDVSGEFPALGEVLIEERDIFLTESLQSAANSTLKLPRAEGGYLDFTSKEPIKVVGVVGIGHMQGIVKRWSEPQQQYLARILTVPPPTFTSKVIYYSFRISFAALGCYVIYKCLPVPRLLKDNLQLFSTKLISNLKGTTPQLRYTLH